MTIYLVQERPANEVGSYDLVILLNNVVFPLPYVPNKTTLYVSI